MKAANVWKANLGAAFLLSCLVAATAFAQTGDPPARVARLSNLKGTVSLQPSGAADWSQGVQNSTLTTGDRVYTDQGGRAELQTGPFAVRLSEATDLTVSNLNDQTMQLGLAQGTIGVTVYQLPSGNNVEVDTPNGALTIQGAGEYRVDTNPNDGSTVVSVNSGSLQVSGGDVSQTVGSGQSVRLTGNNPIQIASVSQHRPDDFDRWGQDLNRPRQSSPSARYVSRDMPGYSDLDNSGRWQDDPQNGPVWYPSGVASNWVPYRNGRWAWVEPWGWTWIEDEPWGFAPFHYGRWAYIGSSWGWLPGPFDARPYYAPALVAFVGGSGFSIGISFGGGGVQAWFPLGQGEPYFPSYHHSDGYLQQVNVTNIRNVTNISNITNITNVNNINYANRAVATTAVPTAVFNSGQAVAHRAIPVTAQQVAKAQIIPHAVATPTAAALAGGRPAPTPPGVARHVPAAGAVQNQPPSTPHANQAAPLVTKNTPPGSVAHGASPAALPPPTRGTAPTARIVPIAAPHTPPLITKDTPPKKNATSGPPQTSLPPPTRTNAAPATSVPAGAARTQPALITKNPLPPHDVPFSAHQPALSAHPGRPLEPQQEQNLRAGKPAGPMQDKEIPAHPAPVVHATPAPRVVEPAPPRAAVTPPASTSSGRPSATHSAGSKAAAEPGGGQPQQ